MLGTFSPIVYPFSDSLVTQDFNTPLLETHYVTLKIENKAHNLREVDV